MAEHEKVSKSEEEYWVYHEVGDSCSLFDRHLPKRTELFLVLKTRRVSEQETQERIR